MNSMKRCPVCPLLLPPLAFWPNDLFKIHYWNRKLWFPRKNIGRALSEEEQLGFRFVGARVQSPLTIPKQLAEIPIVHWSRTIVNENTRTCATSYHAMNTGSTRVHFVLWSNCINLVLSDFFTGVLFYYCKMYPWNLNVCGVVWKFEAVNKYKFGQI